MEKKELKLKFGVFGKGSVGKTSIIKRLIYDRFVDDYDPANEWEFLKKIIVDDKEIMINILDTEGEDEYSTIIESWIKFSQGFILVYSVIDRDSFKKINFWNEKIQNFLKNENYPKILVGNKNDLITEKQVSTEEGKELANKLNCKFIETSAKNGENIKQLFYESCILLMKKEEKKEQKGKEKKKGKCFLM
ncbi:small g-protein ras2 [Anaeramoeba ignava]|uniref:Small g-protein ras2 n=1 Tax=Anaeramoeba ignava TaxID=1746090 RepID=A0A9Q0LCS4_ANAIG|nr:small g-protein ras2 [Anaeramoeba ignava]